MVLGLRCGTHRAVPHHVPRITETGEDADGGVGGRGMFRDDITNVVLVLNNLLVIYISYYTS